MDQNQITPADLQAQWNNHRRAIEQLDRTIGVQALDAEHRVELLRADLVAAEANARQLRAQYTAELVGPTVNLAGLTALAESLNMPLPTDPPPAPEQAPAATAWFDPADPLGTAADGRQQVPA